MVTQPKPKTGDPDMPLMEGTRRHSWRHVRTVTGDYYKVPLSLMVDMAKQFTTAQYTPRVDLVTQEEAVKPVQASLCEFLKAHALVAANPSRMDWALNAEMGEEAAKSFRHDDEETMSTHPLERGTDNL